MTDDAELFTTLEESPSSKIYKKEQATIKEKSVSLKKVMVAELDVMRDTSKVLNNEKQDDEDDLFGKLVAAELKSLPKRQKYRLKHEINNLIFNYKLQNEDEVNRSFQMHGIGIMICESI